MTPRASLAGFIDDPRAQVLAAESLVRGAVVVLPTDTLYGLSAALSHEEAVRRIASIKQAPQERRFIVLASSIEMVERYVASFGCATREDLAARWPAPFTAILPSGRACPAWVGPTVAVRVPAFDPIRALIERVGEPIVSTSVNRTGREPLDDAPAIMREFGDEIDAVFERRGEGGGASTIVDLCGKTARVVRAGGYAWDATGGGKPSK
ncbi:MAG TPA: L-threonylcarbamoyladenylate synthase [Candidatus Krumholzibacteria bacterium]|nr:L-threonylcarbamoyladenylate synthase [Candidatus Krumholzibacteria bacterium]